MASDWATDTATPLGTTPKIAVTGLGNSDLFGTNKRECLKNRRPTFV